MGRPRPDRPGAPGRILHAAARLDVVARRAVSGALLGALARSCWRAPWPPPRRTCPPPSASRASPRATSLNVRAAPSASARDPGARCAPTAAGIEVLALSAGRRLGAGAPPRGVGLGGAALPRGRAARRRAPPRPLACRGTEPFWARDPRRGAARRSTCPRPARCRCAPWARPRGARAGSRAFDLGGPDGGRTLDLTVVRRACSDGMSDRPYGLTALVWATGGGGDRLLEGCCTLQP